MAAEQKKEAIPCNNQISDEPEPSSPHAKTNKQETCFLIPVTEKTPADKTHIKKAAERRGRKLPPDVPPPFLRNKYKEYSCMNQK